MTLVRIALDVPGPAGNTAASGRVRATPTRRRTVADTIVLPVPFVATLLDGLTEVELAPTTADWAWRIDEQTPVLTTRYVAVPASPDPVEYADLVDVDPTTLDPTAEPEAAWTIALEALAAEVEALTGNTAGAVVVETGDEPRPTGPFPYVIWRDIRADQSTPPANITSVDLWVTGEGEVVPPDGETFSVWGTAAPTGVATMGPDGLPRIVTGRGFYKFASGTAGGLPTGRVRGGRVWIAEDAVGNVPTEVTFTLFAPGDDLSDVPVQTKVVPIAGAVLGTWVSGLFDVPQDMGADGAIWTIGAEFTGPDDAGKYMALSGARPNADAVPSTSGRNFAWTDYSATPGSWDSQYRIGTGPATHTGDAGQSYCIDILVDEGP